jgi:hypothetical protein
VLAAQVPGHLPVDFHRSDYHEMSHPMSQSSTIRFERTTPQTAKITFADPP